jgi:hypothetical protein
MIVAGLRSRLVALVFALVVQATIALLGVLPSLPQGRDVFDGTTGTYVYGSQQANFWVQFAVVEFVTAVVVSFAFGPGVRFRDLPGIARVALVLGFGVLPLAAIVLGTVAAAQAAGRTDALAAASTWLATGLFGTLFFGVPLIALARQGPSAPSLPART